MHARHSALRTPHSAFLAAILLLPAPAVAQPSRLPWEPAPRSAEPVLRLPTSPAEVLDRFDIGPTQLANLVDNLPLAPAEQELVLKILHRLPRLGRDNLFRWRISGVSWNQLATAAGDYRAQVFHVAGRAIRAEKQPLPPDQAELFEFPHYFRVTLALDGSPHQAQVLTRRIPTAWPLDQLLDEPTTADALFLKLCPVGQAASLPATSPLLFAAPSLAWHPNKPNPSHNIGPDQLALAKLGLDLSLWDDVHHTNDQPLTAADREGFYQLLAALRRPEAQHLRTSATTPLDVVPLLKDPAVHFGQILPVQGIARRVLKVAVSDADIKIRLGIDHYYEIDLFVPLVGPSLRFGGDPKGGQDTNGSQSAVYENNFPVTLIVPKLPAGLAEGENLHELVRADGVFFKIWTYRSAYASRAGQLQRAPLFLCANARLVTIASTTNWVTTTLVSAAFVLSLAMIALITWFYSYADRRGRRSTASSISFNNQATPPTNGG